MKAETVQNIKLHAETVLKDFQTKSGIRGLNFDLQERSDGYLMNIFLGNPNNRFYEILRSITENLGDEDPLQARINLKKTTRNPWTRSPESNFLRREISDTLNIDRNVDTADFSYRYIDSVSGAEEQIDSAGNHIVYGRRGAGKSSLLVYAMGNLHKKGHPSIWMSMQAYRGRGDWEVIVDVCEEIIEQVRQYPDVEADEVESVEKVLRKIRNKGEKIKAEEIRRTAPRMRQLLGKIAAKSGGLTIFLDDIHVVDREIQPEILSFLFSVSSGNQISLKVSGIERFTRIRNRGKGIGLEVPHDIQEIHLDHNLTMLSESLDHITRILNAHARFCGLSSIGVLCNDKVISRLVWVSAGNLIFWTVSAFIGQPRAKSGNSGNVPEG